MIISTSKIVNYSSFSWNWFSFCCLLHFRSAIDFFRCKFMSDCIQEKVQELQQLQYSDKKIRAALITVRNKHREDETEFNMWHDCLSLLFGTKTRAHYEWFEWRLILKATEGSSLTRTPYIVFWEWKGKPGQMSVTPHCPGIIFIRMDEAFYWLCVLCVQNFMQCYRPKPGLSVLVTLRQIDDGKHFATHSTE